MTLRVMAARHRPISLAAPTTRTSHGVTGETATMAIA